MKKMFQKFFIVAGIIYLLLMYISPQLANFVLALLAALSVPGLIVRHFIIEQLYKSSSSIVARQFVLGKYTIHNEHCTVKYFPDEKIIVMDNIADKSHAKRMFTLTKDKVNINKSWNRVCRVFDSFITLDALVAFYSYDTKIDVITLETRVPRPLKREMKIDASNSGPKFVELGEIQPDPYNKGLEQLNDKGAAFVNIENIPAPKPETQRVEEEIEFHGMGDILSNTSNKIDVNVATSSELSILPGINIVIAKKIVEHRDVNGLFKSEDEFIKVANVKEHFVQKIKSMIIIGKPSENSGNDDDFDGRVVDF